MTDLTNDWRVKLALAPSADYLYKSQDATYNAHILHPLVATNGLVFPYTPGISISYNAAYDQPEIPHTNYKLQQYKNSDVSQISITADFTAQDEYEARYVLASQYFLKALTKMFYGADANAGMPPPLVFLSGYGDMQFKNQPLVISSVSFQYPQDVDYIFCGFDRIPTSASDVDRIKLVSGGKYAPPVFRDRYTTQDTRVPTKMQFTIQCLPVVSRQDMADNYTLENYLKGGMW